MILKDPDPQKLIGSARSQNCKNKAKKENNHMTTDRGNEYRNWCIGELLFGFVNTFLDCRTPNSIRPVNFKLHANFIKTIKKRKLKNALVAAEEQHARRHSLAD